MPALLTVSFLRWKFARRLTNIVDVPQFLSAFSNRIILHVAKHFSTGDPLD